MRTKLRSKVMLLFMSFAMLLAVPAVALADITLDTSATLATDATLPTSVEVGENSFTIKVWRASGNVGASKTGEFKIVNQYNMAADGTITADSTKFQSFDWSDLSCGGSTPPVGCSSTNPATVTAKLIVAAGAQGKTGTLQISQIAAAAETSGIVTDPNPASGFVRVAGKVAGSVTINNIPANAVFGGSFTPAYTKDGDGTPSTTSNTTSVCSVSNAGVVNFDAAGTCKLQASVTEGTNHLAATGAEQTFQIAKAAGSVSITNIPANAVFGGSFTPNVSAAGDGQTSLSSLTPAKCTVSNAGVVNYVGAGTCTLQAAVAAGTNHLAATGAAQSFTIAKANAVIDVQGYTGTYDGDAHGASGTATGADGSDLSSLLDLGASYTNYPGGAANWSFPGDANHNADSGTVQIVINKADADIDVQGYTGTYDGDAHGASGTATGVGGVDLSSLLNLGASYTNYPGGTANWSFAGNTNHNAASGSVAIVINKATPVIEWTPPTAIDHGTALSATQLNATAKGVDGNSLNGSFLYNPLAGTVLNAGTHNLTATFTPNDAVNYTNAQKIVQITVGGYGFGNGFYQPVDNRMLNGVKAGSTVPMKFEVFQSLSGNELKNNTGYIKTWYTTKVNCTSLEAQGEDAIEQYVTGGTSLRWDTSGDFFILNWQAPKAPAGTCYTVTVVANDGSNPANTLQALYRIR